MKITIVGVDPALANFGMARMAFDTETMELEHKGIRLIETTKTKNKVVRRNSDDLRRARDLVDGFKEFVEGAAVIFAEIPTGAQSARAALSFGIAIGILAWRPDIIEIQPTETKKAAVGTGTASKDEMIDWAMEKYPDVPWFTRKFRGEVQRLDKNEHVADATAVIHAGLQTTEFQRLMAMWKVAA